MLYELQRIKVARRSMQTIESVLVVERQLLE